MKQEEMKHNKNCAYNMNKISFFQTTILAFFIKMNDFFSFQMNWEQGPQLGTRPPQLGTRPPHWEQGPTFASAGIFLLFKPNGIPFLVPNKNKNCQHDHITFVLIETEILE